MTQPLDRTCRLPVRGKLDVEAGEFWVDNPFQITKTGQNLSAYERNCLFVNLEGQGFLDVSLFSQTDLDADSRSVIAADFDRDGDEDLLVASVGGGPLRLFENRIGHAAHRVRIELQGTSSNRRGIGARVIAHAGDRQIVRDVFPRNGFMGQGPPELLLGLGDTERLDRLQIRWPSGAWESFDDVPADRVIRIREASGELVASEL